MIWGYSRDVYLQLLSQLSNLQVTTSYFDENMGKVGVKSDTGKVYKVGTSHM